MFIMDVYYVCNKSTKINIPIFRLKELTKPYEHGQPWYYRQPLIVVLFGMIT
jgi:hypothetical protein